ncbi:MAG: thioester reductase domain-containing protein [Streptosporangiaceae bacterium]|nr:thioester reductase domain-containing protein [Streptosporangiaceae bacterium]
MSDATGRMIVLDLSLQSAEQPIAQKGTQLDTILDYIDHWAAVDPDKCFSTFVDRHGNPRETHTYRSLEARTRFLAEYIRDETPVERGDRVALVYPPGLEMVASFVACVRIGAVPVPVPPVMSAAKGVASRLRSVMLDCGAALALTDSSLRSERRGRHDVSDDAGWDGPLAPLSIRWLATDRLQGVARGGLTDNPIQTLFLQYTSGSTGTPKGVVVSHQNVIHNCHSMLEHREIGVSWLPQFHDMGLIGYYLFPLVTGGTTYGFSPLDFLRRPALWLETLSRYRATYTSSPNFGFEYCLSPERVPDDLLESLDLSSVQVFMNASEPVRPSTYWRFLERFARYGLRPAAHVAAYGLAENTLAVTSSGRRSVKINRQSLHSRTVVTAAADTPSGQQLELVSCGKPLDGIHLRIVDPDTGVEVGGNGIGEIWVAGRSTCQAYWNKPELSESVFGNSIAHDFSEARVYLRTGDLGFLQDGELFVCGRLKDIIILKGQNYYPEDLEAAVERASDKIQAGSVVAFRSADGDERLIVVIGLRNPGDRPHPDLVTRSLRAHGYAGPHTIVFVRRQAIERTTSGKVTRSLARDNWLNGDLRTIETYVRDGDATWLNEPHARDVQSGYKQFLEAYALSGDEHARPNEIGLDSLALAGLLVILERGHIETDARGLQGTLDLPLLQHLTISEISALVRGFQPGSADWAINLHAVLTEMKRERNKSEAAAMREDAFLFPSGGCTVPRADHSFNHVLMTGATGFLGPFLLRSLLDQTSATYTILVRATDPSAARERLITALETAGLYDLRTRGVFDTRVRVICGDLARPRLGLSDRHWSQLAETIDTIVHNAAWVDYILDYQALRLSNVEGTRELIELARTSLRKQFHFVSSTTIFGWSVKQKLLERDSNPEMSALDFGYAQTKWVSEHLVLQARDQGLDARIYRPAFLTASTAGFGHSTDIVARLLSFMIKYRVAPNTGIQLSLMPVDIAAHNMAAVMTSAEPQDPVLHVTVDEYFNIIDLTTQISKDYGISFRYVDLEEFSREMKRLCTIADPAFPLLDFVVRSHSKVAAMEHKRYDNTAFRLALKHSGAGVADASLQEAASFLMAHLKAQRMLPEG